MSISTEITLTDNMSATLNAIYSSANSVNAVFETLNSTMDSVDWVSPPNFEYFGGNDVERYQNEIESANEMLQQLTFTQEQVSVAAQNMDILPQNAVDDISGMSDRIAALRSQIENVQQSRIEVVGIEQANAEVENLRAQLTNALQVQENMNVALSNMDASGANRAYMQLNSIINDAERNIRGNINQQQNFNDEIVNGTRNANVLKRMIAGVVGVFSVRAAVGWLRQSTNITNENIRLEQQLANVMANRGATYEEFVRLQERAAQIQADTNDMISGTTMMGAANELSRHVGSVEAIEIMMDSLANFASGAGNIFGATAQDMAAYAEYFTQAMAGNYRMLERRAGIHLTETQKQVIQYGDDMQRALMIQEIVNQSWYGLAEQMAATPEGMRVGMTNAINDIRSSIGAQLIPMLMILFSTIQAHMPQIEAALQGIVPPVQFIIGLITQLISLSFGVYDAIVNNWGMIEPIIWGIVGAFAAWKAITIMLAIKKSILTGVIWAKTIALLANPITWIILLIGVLITAIVAWINHMGGLHAAWLYTVNGVLTAWDWLQIGFFTGIHAVMDGWDRMALGMRSAGVGIQNYMGDTRTNVLKILQDMVNGSIDIINGFISVLNNLPMVSIDAIEQVTFAVKAQAENDAARNSRNNALEAYRADIEANIAQRAALREQMRADAQTATADRLAQIYAIRNAEVEYEANINHRHFVNTSGLYGEGFGNLGRDVSDIAANTGEMASISGKNLKYWRDIAERDNINRFTTAKIDFRNTIHNNINSSMDLDEVIEEFTEGVEEAMHTTAERVNDYHGV